MESDFSEKDVVLVLADITGYTQFMTANQKSLAHSQLIISELLKSVLKEVELPLTLAKLEGDAAFLYAVKDDDHRWPETGKKIGDKLQAFSRAFGEKASELTVHRICECDACSNIEGLRLKLIAHSGRAVFFKIGDVVDLSGTDVIIAHRLLKNSIPEEEYILLSQAAQQDIQLEGAPLHQTVETYDALDPVETVVYATPERVEYQYDPEKDPGYTSVFVQTLREEVQREYSEVATSPEKGFHFHTGRPLTRLVEYQDEWLEGIPEENIASFAGTGNPFSVGPIKPGEHVVDVGCGAGMDLLIAARMTGPTGRAIGVEMTPAMREKAMRGAQAMGFEHVEVRDGLAEKMPIEDGWADVIISNGVLNLCPDKLATLREFRRILKPDGRLQIGDILVQKAVPVSAKNNIDLWAG